MSFSSGAATAGAGTIWLRRLECDESTENWGIHLNVEKVKKGSYSELTFTFTVHSPVRARLWVGCRYTIEATWNGQRYEVHMSGIKVEVCNR